MFSDKTRAVLEAQARKTVEIMGTQTNDQRAADAFAGVERRGAHRYEPTGSISGAVGSAARILADRNATVGPIAGAYNVGRAAIQGAGSGVIGLAGIADGALGGVLGTDEMATGWNRVNRALTPDNINRRNDAQALNQAALYQENQEIADDAYGSGNVRRSDADMGRLAADFMDGARGALSSPLQLGQGMGNAAGSFLVGGAASKVAKAGLTGILPRLGSFGRAAMGNIDEVAGTVGMGGMEAGSAGIQAAQAVDRQTHEQLLAGSDNYRAYLSQHGDTPDSRVAARQIAKNGARGLAMITQAPAAVLAGQLTGKLAMNPFAAGSVKGTLANAGREAIEEAMQEGSGNLSSNNALRVFANRDQDLLDGVGSGAAEGAIFGGLSVGGMQVPGAVANATVQAATQAGKAVMERGRQINGRMNAAKAEKANAETVATVTDVMNALRAKYAPVEEAEPVITEDGTVAEPTEDELEAQTFNPQLQELGGLMSFDRSTYADGSDSVSEFVNTLPEGEADDIFTVMLSAADRIQSPDTTPEQKTELAVFMSDLQERMDGPEITQVLDTLTEGVRPEGALAQEIKMAVKAKTLISSNETIKAALETALAAGPKVTLADVEDISTPEGQLAAKKAAMWAVVSPETLPPEIASRLMKHSSNGGNFKPREKAALRTVIGLVQTVKAMSEEAKKLGLKEPKVATVADEAQMYKYDQSGDYGPSIAGHYELINKFDSYGQSDETKAALIEFQAFAQHMANKLAAVNAAHSSRKATRNTPMSFDSYSRKTGWKKDGGSVNIISQNLGSVALGQQIGVDAGLVVDSFNKLNETFPELGLGKVHRDQLHSDLTAGPAKMVVKQTFARDAAEKKGNTTPPQQTQKQEAPKENKPPVKEETAKVATKVTEPDTKPAPVAAETKAEPAPEVSRITRDQAKGLSDAGLQERIDKINDRKVLNEARPGDQATFDVLNDEMNEREDAYFAEGKAQEAAEKALENQAKPANEEVSPPKEEKTDEAPVAPVVEEAPKLEMKDAFPDLVRDEEGDANLFTDGFTLDNESRTRMVGENKLSLSDIYAGLMSGEALNELSGMAKTKIDSQITAAYKAVIRGAIGVAEKMAKDLQNDPRAKKYRDYGKEPIQRAIRTKDRRLLNLMVRDGATVKYSQEVMTVGLTALANWLAKNSAAKLPKNAEEIARALGLGAKPLDIDGDVIKAFNSGNVQSQVHNQLMADIKSMMGLKSKGDVPNGLSDGVLLSFAGELLDAAQSLKLIRSMPVTVKGEKIVFLGLNKDVIGLDLTKDETAASFKGKTTLIEQIVMQDESIGGIQIGKPSGKTRKTLMGGSTPQTEEQTETQIREGAIPNRANASLWELFKHIGVGGVLELFANGEYLPETLNKEDRKSKEGQNLSYSEAFNVAKGVIDEMTKYAEEEGIELEEVSAYYDYGFSSVSRMQQLAAYGTQGSKFVRELITPVGVLMDLSDPNSDQTSMWRRGIAQGLGVKIDKLRDENWEQKLSEELVKMAPAIEALRDPTAIDQRDLVDILRVAKVNTPVALHALKSYADYLNSEDRGEFFTHIYVEADGVADGVTNSLIYMRLGGFDLGFVEGLQRGGISFSQRAIPLHELFDPTDGSEPLIDTYVNTSFYASKEKTSTENYLVNKAADQKKVTAHIVAVNKVLEALIGKDFSFKAAKDGKGVELVIGRGQLKNPMTITVYGSGADGIAANITSEILSVLYSEISKAHAAAADIGEADNWKLHMFLDHDAVKGDYAAANRMTVEFFEALDIVGTHVLVDSKNKGKVFSFKPNMDAPTMPQWRGTGSKAAVEYKINKGAADQIAKTVRLVYVDPMVTAINKQMGSSIAGAKLIQAATNTMSGVAKVAFDKLLGAAVAAELAKGGTRTDGLSPNQLKRVFKKVQFLLPYMEGDTITVNVKGAKSGAYNPIDPATGQPYTKTFPAQALTKEVEVGLLIPVPQMAGVAGSAYVNISYGDGRMIIKASPGLTGGRLHVFDGINLALDKAKENGVAINKAVLEALQTATPFADLLKGFSNLSNVLDFSTFTEDEIQSIEKLIKPKEGDTAQTLIRDLTESLETAAFDEKARQRVLRKVHISSDHMAAVGAPASTDGDTDRIDLSGLTAAQQTDMLNDMLADERRAMEKEMATKAVEKMVEGKPDLAKVVSWLPTHSTWVRELSAAGTLALIDGLVMPAEQKQLAKRALQSLKGKNWKVAFGSLAQVNAYLASKGNSEKLVEGDHGATDMSRKLVVVTNNSLETLVHELIHASTMDRVSAFYADPQSVDEYTRGAVERLDAMMIEWLDTAQDAATLLSESTRKTVSIAARTVQDLILAGDQAAALNEFMAWNLTNQDLVKLNKSMKVDSPLVRILKGVLTELRAMFGLPAKGSDMFSNLRFNTSLLMSKGLPPIGAKATQLLLHSSKTRPDLAEITNKFARVIDKFDTEFAQKNPSAKGLPSGLTYLAISDLVKTVGQYGFTLTADERKAFVQVAAAFRLNLVIDPSAFIKMDRYYSELLEQLKKNQSDMMMDPNSTDPDELIMAQERIKLLEGSVDVGVDIKNRKMLLPLVVALATTSSQAQKLFNRFETRDTKAYAKGTTADTILKTWGAKAVDGAMDLSLGIKPNQQIAEQIQDIMSGVTRQLDAEKTELAKAMDMPAAILDKGNTFLSDTMADGLDLFHDSLETLAEKAKGTKVGSATATAVKVIQGAAAVFNKRKVGDLTVKLTSHMDSIGVSQNIRALYAEFVGMTTSNQAVLELTKRVRGQIHRVRQMYRVVMPKEIGKEFTRKMTAEEYADMHKMGQTGIAILIGQKMTSSAVLELVTDVTKRDAAIAQREADIKQLFGTASKDVLQDAWALRRMMTTGTAENGLVKRNALAIANRVGSSKVGSLDWNSAEVQAVDAYVSLLAVKYMPAEAMKSLVEMSKTEAKGLSSVLALVAEAHAEEMRRVPEALKYNVPKGYMPKEAKGSFKVVPTDKVEELERAGWRVVGTRMAGQVESLIDAKRSDMVYMATDLSAPPFKQGILQTVRSTAFGLNTSTGGRFDDPSGGLITDPKKVQQIAARLRSNANNDPLLTPLYDADGSLWAFERAVEANVVSNAIEYREHAAVAVGRWMGRQFEEEEAKILNEVLIDRLTEMYEQGTDDEFYDLFEEAKTNPVIAKALSLISDADRKRISDKMGGKFMVRKHLYENVLGYHTMSIGDLWTGNNKMEKDAREAAADFLTGILGPKAYQYLTTAEQGWANLMGDARVAIVVKSMLVPALNGIANFYQLMMNGISPVTIAKQSALKLRETQVYMENELKYQNLGVQLAIAKGNNRPDQVRLIETQMVKIEDLNKHLSIYPLIQAGELTQVTEGLSDEDMDISKGRIWDYVSKQADKLPPAVKTAGRYAVVAKDTALFQGLAKSVAYTDFIAKAILHDHLTQQLKLDPQEVKLRIANEFVNYDLLPGRARARAEELGLVWFQAYKIRIAKVAFSLIRNNPLYVLMIGHLPGADVAGTAIDDNIFNLIREGRFFNSFGVGNSMRAVWLNPLAQILS